jgi:hypothetical protein
VDSTFKFTQCFPLLREQFPDRFVIANSSFYMKNHLQGILRLLEIIIFGCVLDRLIYLVFIIVCLPVSSLRILKMRFFSRSPPGLARVGLRRKSSESLAGTRLLGTKYNTLGI